MTKNLDRSRGDGPARVASNDDTQRLMAAGQRLAAEVSRLFTSGPDIADRHYWLETMVNHIPDYIYAKDLDGRFLIANQATVTENGFQEAHEIVGKTDFDIHTPENARHFAEAERRVIETGEPMFGIEELNAVSKEERWLMTSKVPLRNKQGATIGIVGVSRDITDRKKAERLLLGQARLLEMIAKSTPLVDFFNELILMIEAHLPGILGSILLLSADGRHLLTGAAPGLDKGYCQAIHGIEIGPKVGSCGTAAWRGETVFVADILSDPLWEDVVDFVRPFGYRSCWSTPIRSYQGKVLGTFALYSHEVGVPSAEQNELISMAAHLAGIAIERRQSEERIQFMAHHDALTGLPNRVLFDERVASALREARAAGQWLALAFLDLDNFKLINDTLGHHAGDELLRLVAGRMLACVRKSDMIVRVGGDEFIILLTGLPPDSSIVTSRFEDIRTAIGAPLVLSGRSLQVSCSMGVVCYPDHGQTATELLANADAAMYRAKEVGRNNLQLFDVEMARKARERLLRHEELRDAVARGEFLLHYQPQMNLKTGGVTSVEALVRWNHPIYGAVSPSEFVTLAEATDLIHPLTYWAIRAALADLKRWNEKGAELRVAINISARVLQDVEFPSRLKRLLHEAAVRPEQVECEITESAMLVDPERAKQIVKELHALGVLIAIDDYGTGFSSLGYLRDLRVHSLKLDKSFVVDLETREQNRVIVESTAQMAHALGLQVVAEGVETKWVEDYLRSIGYDLGQGYLFARPMPADDCYNWIVRASGEPQRLAG